MTRCVLIRNPAARHRLDDATLTAAVDVLRAAGWDVAIAATEREGHATEIARAAAARGVDVIVANGGDGTINEIINGIANTEAALAVMPGGTANVWAREIGVSKKPIDAMRQAVTGERRRVDLGIATVGAAAGRYFLLMAGVGLDAEIIPAVSATCKRRIGAAAYIVKGVLSVFGSTHWHARVAIDGDASDTDLYWMIIGNTRSYGGFTDIMFRARADDGLLDIGLMHRGGVKRVIADGIRVLRKKHADSANIDYITARTVDVQTPGIAVQVDGEAAGVTPARFEVAPLALRVVVPAGLRSPLFVREL